MTSRRGAARWNEVILIFLTDTCLLGYCRSQWPHGLRHQSAAADLLGLRIRIPVGAARCQVEVSASGQITRPEDFYRVRRVLSVIVKSG